jgi:predicted DNA-binding WGR domain protein
MTKRYFEFVDAKSSKFWEADTKGKTLTVRYGKIGTDGQITAKDFESPEEAASQTEKLIEEKTKKGYVEKDEAKSAQRSKVLVRVSLTLEPEWQKCVTQVEFWRKGDLVIERAQLWRFGSVTVVGISEAEIKKSFKKRDEQDRVCITELFNEVADQTLKDCISDDFFYPDDMPVKETIRLGKLLAKNPEAAFEKESWSIQETKLYFESQINVKPS